MFLSGRLYPYSQNIRLGRKGLPGTNALAYFSLSLVTKEREFYNNDTRLLRNAKPIEYLLKWICETDYENEDQQVNPKLQYTKN